MPNILMQVAFHADSAIPADVAVNTYNFVGPATETNAIELVNAWENHIDGVQATSNNIASYLSGAMSGEVTVKLYDRADALPRVPFWTDARTIAVSPAGAGDLPSEVALVVSYAANAASGENAARRRGRVFYGPLSMPGSTLSDMSRPTEVMVLTFVQAFAQFAQEVRDTTTPNLMVVWSQTDAAAYTAERIWCDNAWDTQRRRGLRATDRETAVIG